MEQHLFLFGGGPPFGDEHGKAFAEISSKRKGSVAILCLDRPGWCSYMPKYQNVLESYGVTSFKYYPLSDSTSILATDCSGIIICGGETGKYYESVVDTSLGMEIKSLYQEGVPVAGFSAGALICPEHCVISPKDNSRNEQIFLKGLGLIDHCVISVHFTEWNDEENLKRAMDKTGCWTGYGLDDGASIYYKQDRLYSIDGEQVHFYKSVV